MSLDSPACPSASHFIAYVLSDGSERWLGISPQGKYPVRFGPLDNPPAPHDRVGAVAERVDRKAPLDRFYCEASIVSLGEGVRSFQRWASRSNGQRSPYCLAVRGLATDE